MQYGVIPNILLISAIVVIIAIVLRRLPETTNTEATETGSDQKKINVSSSWTRRVMTFLGFWFKRFWLFVLEAKDLKPSASVSYKIKKIFKKKSQPKALEVPTSIKPQEAPSHSVANEDYFLKAIEKNPKELSNYVGLGKFYLDSKQFGEAKDIYEFLTTKEPGNANHYAKLGYSSYKLGQFDDAVKSYEKSLALDSAQPNRYYNLGLTLEAQGKLDESMVALNRAISLEQNQKYITTLRHLEEKISKQKNSNKEN